tara:strand:- start:372 stop:593 length:222 start_codon:yes stop_codon:yes gene_type:complete
MSFKAVFIGGAFDMTKRELRRDEPYVYFYEPEDKVAISCGVPEEKVVCRKLQYRLVTSVSDGTLIYEIDKIDI